MAHKTFISYKYSEAKRLRDRIIAKLGDNASYYQGETSESPDYSDRTTEYIKTKLKDMIRDTSVTIVILSPNIKLSKWVNWELEYSLREIPTYDKTSHTNGVVAVVQKQETYGLFDGYAWMKNSFGRWDYNSLLSIIRDNQNNKKYHSPNCLSNSYIDIVTEEDFLYNPSKYIEEAFTKSQNIFSYNVVKKGGMW